MRRFERFCSEWRGTACGATSGRSLAIDSDASHSSVAACDPRPSTIAARNAEHHRLFEAMRHIPLELQVVLELHYWEDMTTHELAVALDLPQGTVKSRMRRAREALREVLESPEFVSSTPTPHEEELAHRVRGLRPVLDAC